MIRTDHWMVLAAEKLEAEKPVRDQLLASFSQRPVPSRREAPPSYTSIFPLQSLVCQRHTAQGA